MAETLKGKVVFITGANSGIGAASAMAFAEGGARLLLCARRLDKLQGTEAELRGKGAEDLHTFQLDVRDGEAVEKALNALPDSWKEIDILINNAGLARGLGKFWEDDIQNWEEMIDTNTKGLLYVTRHVVPGMVARNRGHVINLGSTAGHGAYAGGSVYCATKSAERAITDGLRIDLNGTAIRVTSIDPGMVETDFSSIRFRGDTGRAAKVYQGVVPLTAEDIAETIVWTATRPPHVQIQTVLLTCVDQANSFVVHRRS